MSNQPNEMMFPEPCIVHMSSNDADCDVCKTEIAAIEEQMIATNKEIVSIVSQLEMQGYDVDVTIHLAAKLDTLIASLLKGNHKAHAKFDATVAVNVLREMVNQQAEVAREKLLS